MLLIYIFGLIFYSTIVAAKEGDANTQQVLCQFEGQRTGSSYKFNKDDVNERCGKIVYGYYAMDGFFYGDYPVPVSDATAIKTLKQIQKDVYIMVGFDNDDGWASMFYPPDENAYATARDTLIRFLSEYNVTGIILDKPKIYCGQSDLAEKINSIASEMKKLSCNLQFGLIIDGNWYESFSKDDLFDFGVTNANVDLYIIDTTTVNECTPETKCSGVLPISGNDNDLISLEQICDAAYSSSSMEKSKLYVRLLVGVRRPIIYGEVYPPTSYTEYCNAADHANGYSTDWCADTSQTLYEKGKHVKQKQFQGLMLSVMETDDFCKSCKCEQFLATNKIIDGWESKTFQICANIDQPQ